MKKVFYILILLVVKNFHAQDPVFSQYNFNPMYLNPALAGMDNNFRMFMNKRSQWSKIPSQFNINSISLDSWQNGSNSALSMMFSSGNEGEAYMKTNNFYFGGAYRLFDVFPSPIAWQFGFQYQNISKSLDFSRLVFSDQLDHYLGNISSSAFIAPSVTSFNTSNLALGTVFTYHIKRGPRSKRFHAPLDLDIELGLAVHNFVQRPNGFQNDLYNFNRKYTLHGSVIWPLKAGKIAGGVKHSGVYINQGSLSTLQIGLAEAWIYPLHLGVFYRQQMSSLAEDLDKYESLYFIFGYQKVMKQSNLSLTFSYSRDFTISELGSYTNGVNEISIIIESIEGGLFAGLIHSKKHAKNKYRSIPCYSKFNTRAGLTR